MYNATSNPSDSGRQDGTALRGVQQVGDTLHNTIDRVATPVKDVLDRASSTAHQTVDRVASGMHSAAEKVDAQTRRARQLPNDVLESAREHVRAQPLQTVALAAALGWLFGRLGR
jgi:ElaB/YqjD/DUF883 family membrane-anchored ribosome-binding protein